MTTASPRCFGPVVSREGSLRTQSPSSSSRTTTRFRSILTAKKEEEKEEEEEKVKEKEKEATWTDPSSSFSGDPPPPSSPSQSNHPTRMGTPHRHVPVLLKEVVKLVTPPGARLILDATFGAGGYTRAILAACPWSRVVAVDQDPQAIEIATAMMEEEGLRGRLFPFHGRFGDLGKPSFQSFLASTGTAVSSTGLTARAPFDAVVFDIGVSSMQLDGPSRGFSFQKGGNLNMRMDATADGAVPDGLTAQDVVNTFTEDKLADIIFKYGEERHSRRIAAAIVKARSQKGQITGTTELADIVADATRKFSQGERHAIHPATRTFQALRIFVNRELEELQYGLHGAERLLRPGGILGVVTFHSLEDRIVKNFLRNCASPDTAHLPSFGLLNKSVVTASPEEVGRNSRARSAKLRTATRLLAPSMSHNFLFA